VVARNRIMNESLWHLVPPSVKAGCGGIDLFGGSFSFISMEQFQNLLRAIASNAAGYAFEIALQTMCKDCMEVMETLQKKLLALNQGFANSCQLAKGIVNDVADAFDIAHKDKNQPDRHAERYRRPVRDALDRDRHRHRQGRLRQCHRRAEEGADRQSGVAGAQAQWRRRVSSAAATTPCSRR